MLKTKQIGAVLLAGTLAFTMVGCGKKKEKPQEATTESMTENTTDAIDEDVEVPEDFESMFYPMKALALENYFLGYPYYVQFADGSSRDSFWYSCALTTKLCSEEEGNTIEVEEENFNQIVSALYASYQQGNLEFPEIRDGVPYAKYNDDGTSFIFSNRDEDYIADDEGLDRFSLTITSCETSEDGYTLEAELEDTNTGSSLGVYEYEIIPTEYSNGNGNVFSYSVVSMYDANEASTIEEGQDTTQSTDENSNSTTETTEDSQNKGQEGSSINNTEATTEEVNNTPETDLLPEENEDNTEESENNAQGSGEISEDIALNLAKDSYGSNASYTYQGLDYIDAYPYYKFSVQSDELSISYVLVSLSGNDVVGANKNSDGSWSFDQ